MTQLKPYIVVKRLVITSGAQIAYDEKYDEGVNIIRGRNSSGKSTIADFLFFALGGDLPRLKDEAKLCDHTFLEVSLSGKVFTLKRVVQEKSRQGMDIFEGCFAEAKASGLNGWLRYPYNATEYKEGYYQAILKELGIPYSKSDDKSSITLHQILRLMYVDQMTSLDRLFKFDSFDSSNKRNAIGELLLGISDFELYGYRIKAQRVEAILDAKIRDIKTLHQFFGDEIKPVESIDEEILARRKEIDSLEEELFKDKTTDKDHFGQESLHDLRKKVFEIRAELRKLLEEKSSCSFDISDSQNFVSSLHSRLESLQESGNVISVLSDIGFHFCPACFNKVDQKIEGCKLCGFDTESEDSEIDPTFKILKEIEFQVSESNKLISLRQDRLATLELAVNQQQVYLESMLRDLASLERPIEEVSSEKRKILLKIGSINRDIKNLNEGKNKYAKLHDLYENRKKLQNDLNDLKTIIERKEKFLEANYTKKRKKLSELTKVILQADKNHEEVFQRGKTVNFDFGEDRVSIDDRALFSASSMVYLKNAFRLALLEASCQEQSYLYPRFLLMDNIEDKGMEPHRSHTFQNEIVRVSKNIKVPHQIIFTTSMIAPNLDGSTYCVGEYYNESNKSLRIPAF